MSNIRVNSIWRFPVKSFQGEKIEKAIVGNGGILGDRAYALVEKESGKVVTGKSVRKFPEIMMCSARYTSEPVPGEDLPEVKIVLADGREVMSGDTNADEKLSEFFKTEVALRKAVPDEFVIDQYHPDLADLDPFGNRDTTVEQKLGSSLFKSMGAESPLPEGSFMDVFPLSVITSSTLKNLSSLAPETNFDVRRFRMNLVMDTLDDGFLESEWIGKKLQINNDLVLVVTMHDPRCVMTTLAQPGLERDTGVLKALVNHNRHDLLGAGKFPCAGVYAIAGNGGSVNVGDSVTVIS